jgi:deoxyribonuclease V
MIAVLDAAYAEDRAGAGCVLAHDWAAETPAHAFGLRSGAPQPYVPGAFYQRELPLLLALLRATPAPFSSVLVDGYVWLDGSGRPGLGAHLYEALGGAVPVVGIAKTRFAGDAFAVEVCRGASARPLYLTTAGIEPGAAADHVRGMHGCGRIPTLVRAADALARAHLSSAAASG